MANQYDTNLKLQAIADAIGDSQSSGLISALEDIADAVAGGGGGSSAGLVSDNFSETDTYDLGDYCIHNNTMYVCINAITTPGPWDISDWQATNAGKEISSLNSALGNIEMINAGQLNFNNGVATYNYPKAKTTGRYMAQRSAATVHSFLCTAKCLTNGVITIYAFETIGNGTPRQGTLSDIIILADNR